MCVYVYVHVSEKKKYREGDSERAKERRGGVEGRERERE